MNQVYRFEHAGYVLQQTDYNWHYVIFEKESGKVIMEAQCTVKLDEESAKKHIAFCLKKIEKIKRKN
ncbi:MAG: hypothetical protein IJO50_03050 [Clostridia bacterium]|nr:hypothetical protein [Clostridia bacterium]